MSSSVLADQNVASLDPKPMRILVAGGSGFIGRRLILRLTDSRKDTLNSSNNQILCMTRNPESVKEFFTDKVRVVKGDVSDYEDLKRIMTSDGTIDAAYYLVHSMEGNSRSWKKFADRDRKAALNFAKAASNFGIKHIIYLGGLSHREGKQQSEHMKSRDEVGEILRTASAKTTVFKAAVIIGQGGGSFQMLQYLVERLPVMVCPRWVLTKSQPISVDDVVTYLEKALEIKEADGRIFEIGGPDVLTYVDMMRRYASMRNKRIRILIIPFLTPRLSSYWIDLVTPVGASLARPLIDSLKHEATVRDDSVKKVIPIQPRSFDQSIAGAIKEKVVSRNLPVRKERTSQSINTKILVIALLALVSVGSAYYIVQRWQDPFQPGNLALLFSWYVGIAFALYFIRKGARLGALVAGIIGWVTMTFWLIEGQGRFLGASQPDMLLGPIALWLNVLGLVTVSIEIAASHNIFHKLRMVVR
jgi:uncharacterized protein YbjT (DUF2867 family)